MKILFLGLALLEVVSGLTVFETVLRLFFGQPLLKELKDFPRCGRPGTETETNFGGTRRTHDRSSATASPGEEKEDQQGVFSFNRNHIPEPFSADYCSSSDKCSYGEGDCDNDSQCHSPLVCGVNNCRNFSSSAPDWQDCCIYRERPTAQDVSDQYNGITNVIKEVNFPQEYDNNRRTAWRIQPRSSTRGMYHHVFIAIFE